MTIPDSVTAIGKDAFPRRCIIKGKNVNNVNLGSYPAERKIKTDDKRKNETDNEKKIETDNKRSNGGLIKRLFGNVDSHSCIKLITRL